MPGKLYVGRNNTEPNSDDHYWFVVDDLKEALDVVPGAVYVGEYRLVRVLKVSEGQANVEVVRK